MSDARHLSTLFSVGSATGLTDVELLDRFLERRDRADTCLAGRGGGVRGDRPAPWPDGPGRLPTLPGRSP